MPEEKDPKEQEEQQRQIMQSGSVTTETHGKHVIHCLLYTSRAGAGALFYLAAGSGIGLHQIGYPEDGAG